MTTMLGVKAQPHGGIENLKFITLPRPEATSHEVLIEVHACGLNRLDILQRKGHYPPPAGVSDVLGVEAAGVVKSIGSQVSKFKVGDKVMALLAGGGYAHYVVAHEGSVLPVPEGYSFMEAAATPEALFTVWYNVFSRARLQKGERFLVHGGTSGIGTWAIQMAKAWGAQVFATAGSDEKCALIERLGGHGINYKTQNFVEFCQQATDRAGVDVILDMVGGSYTAQNIELCAVDGRITQIAFLQGKQAELNLQQLCTKRLMIMGSTLRAQSAQNKAQMAKGLWADFGDHLMAGKLRPVIDKVFTFEDVSAAHQRLESADHAGKIVLQLR